METEFSRRSNKECPAYKTSVLLIEQTSVCLMCFNSNSLHRFRISSSPTRTDNFRNYQRSAVLTLLLINYKFHHLPLRLGPQLALQPNNQFIFEAAYNQNFTGQHHHRTSRK
jgi:hypothetical protein